MSVPYLIMQQMEFDLSTDLIKTMLQAFRSVIKPFCIYKCTVVQMIL